MIWITLLMCSKARNQSVSTLKPTHQLEYSQMAIVLVCCCMKNKHQLFSLLCPIWRPRLGKYHLERAFIAFEGTQLISIHSQAYTSVRILPTAILLAARHPHDEQIATFSFGFAPIYGQYSVATIWSTLLMHLAEAMNQFPFSSLHIKSTMPNWQWYWRGGKQNGPCPCQQCPCFCQHCRHIFLIVVMINTGAVASIIIIFTHKR